MTDEPVTEPARRALLTHHRGNDGHCMGCLTRTDGVSQAVVTWPCVTARIALGLIKVTQMDQTNHGEPER